MGEASKAEHQGRKSDWVPLKVANTRKKKGKKKGRVKKRRKSNRGKGNCLFSLDTRRAVNATRSGKNPDEPK